MNTSTKFTFRILTGLLIFLIAGDSLAIFDILDPSGLDSHFLNIEDTPGVHQNDSEDGRDLPEIDRCILCPCCVSGVNMYISSFVFTAEKQCVGVLVSEDSQQDGFSEKHIFRPPKHLS